MRRIAEPDEISLFLMLLRDTASRPTGFDLIPRKENLDALAEFGLERTYPRTVVRSFTIREYSLTDEDRDRPGEVWVFGKKIQNMAIPISPGPTHFLRE
ncbi:MAG: hypothetical protein K6T83_15170 [Alicyclobacillus sp.]|nr:hypothetical protein [Alicyclobacillus sp.]